jgi:hypothetical protein
VRRFYVACRRDRGITYGFQQTLVAAMPCEKVFTINADHSQQLPCRAEIGRRNPGGKPAIDGLHERPSLVGAVQVLPEPGERALRVRHGDCPVEGRLGLPHRAFAPAFVGAFVDGVAECVE